MSTSHLAPSGAFPRTAEDALALWDEGKPVLAFQVETQGSEQHEIYAFAFELLRGKLLSDLSQPPLSERERGVAYSIAEVARAKGWGAMLRQHIGPGIPAITIQKGS